MARISKKNANETENPRHGSGIELPLRPASTRMLPVIRIKKKAIPQAITASGLRPLGFLEYDVEYVVRDIESLVFWLNALDPKHADVDGRSALASAESLNRVLSGNVDERGFVTNEHRYVAIAQSPAHALSKISERLV